MPWNKIPTWVKWKVVMRLNLLWLASFVHRKSLFAFHHQQWYPCTRRAPESVPQYFVIIMILILLWSIIYTTDSLLLFELMHNTSFISLETTHHYIYFIRITGTVSMIGVDLRVSIIIISFSAIFDQTLNRVDQHVVGGNSEKNNQRLTK